MLHVHSRWGMVILAAEASVDEAISEPMTELQAMSTRNLAGSVDLALSAVVCLHGNQRSGGCPVLPARHLGIGAARSSDRGLHFLRGGRRRAGFAGRDAYRAAAPDCRAILSGRSRGDRNSTSRIGPAISITSLVSCSGRYLLVQAAEPACRLAIAGMKGMFRGTGGF